jgi:hypothetical protein
MKELEGLDCRGIYRPTSLLKGCNVDSRPDCRYTSKHARKHVANLTLFADAQRV